jgi:hypothetical protein
MSNANAALTSRARLRLARLIVDQGWPIARAAERYDVVCKIVHIRCKQRLGPVAIGKQLGWLSMASSTVHAVLACRLNRLSHIDGIPRRTGPPLDGWSVHLVQLSPRPWWTMAA